MAAHALERSRVGAHAGSSLGVAQEEFIAAEEIGHLGEFGVYSPVPTYIYTQACIQM